MPAPRTPNLATLLPRIPVAALGVMVAASALQASCSGGTDMGDLGDAEGADADIFLPDARVEDSPSADSRADVTDGMSYGDGYGTMDAHVGADGSCVSSTVTHPPARGCPPGNHTWSCWAPTPVAGGIPSSSYTVLTLCGDVVVIDENTKLMWGQEGEAGTYTWVAAAAACTSSRRAGFSDWRLPSSNELMSLVNYASSTVILSSVFTGNYPTMWSSTPFVQQSGNAWQLYASGGIYPQVIANESNVRCVR